MFVMPRQRDNQYSREPERVTAASGYWIIRSSRMMTVPE
jgi:hypothetical protein